MSPLEIYSYRSYLKILLAEIKRNMTRDHGGCEWSLPELRRALSMEINIFKRLRTANTDYISRARRKTIVTANFLKIYFLKFLCTFFEYTCPEKVL
jgi:hypothetical protein